MRWTNTEIETLKTALKQFPGMGVRTLAQKLYVLAAYPGSNFFALNSRSYASIYNQLRRLIADLVTA